MNEDVSPIENATFPSSHVSFFGGKKHHQVPMSHGFNPVPVRQMLTKLFNSPWTEAKRKLNECQHHWLVVAFFPPVLKKKMRKSNWIISPKALRGENSKYLKPPT